MSSEKFRVLVVDDEENDRSVVNIFLQRQYGELFEVFEAESAGEAKNVLEKQEIDLLIADIHMPEISGLDLIKEIRRENSNLYIMILTAYDYFEYAKEAIVYQVNDFVLKPPLRKEFYEAVQRFLDWAQEERATRRAGEKDRIVFIRELGDYIMLNAGQKKIDAYKTLLNIREDYVFCILIDTKVFRSLKTTSFQDEIESAMSALGVPFAISHMPGQTAIFCFAKTDTLGYEELRFPVRLKVGLDLELGAEATMATGEVVSVYDNPRTSYLRAESLLQDQEQVDDHEGSSIGETVVSYIKDGENEEAIRTFSQFLLRYGEEHEIDELMLKDIEILTFIRKSFQVRQERIGVKMVDIFATGSVDDIVKFSTSYLREIVGKSNLEPSQEKHHVVRKICDRVEAQVNQAWSINDFANEYGFNPFYLSRLFKDEINLCFKDYLTGKRVEKAIEYMKDVNLTIREIGELVGYSDQNYFSRVFKKYTSMGPQEYRKTFSAK